MNHPHRRLLALALAAALSLSLAACGGSASSASSASSAASAASAAGTSSAGTSAAADLGNRVAGELRIGMECAYPPNNWQEDHQTDTNVALENLPGFYAEGYDVQIARVIAKQLGLTPVVVKLEWSGLIQALNEGQIDVIIAGMADTAERRQSINFSDPYSKVTYGVLVKKSSSYAGATSIADFAGASLLGQKDTLYDTVIDQIAGVNHLPAVDSVPAMIARLDQDTADGLVIDGETAQGYLNTYPDFTFVSFAEGKGFSLGFVGSCVGIRMDDTKLLDAVNAALATIPQDQRDQMKATAIANQPT